MYMTAPLSWLPDNAAPRRFFNTLDICESLVPLIKVSGLTQDTGLLDYDVGERYISERLCRSLSFVGQKKSALLNVSPAFLLHRAAELMWTRSDNLTRDILINQDVSNELDHLEANWRANLREH